MIVPSIDLAGGHAVQLVGGKEQVLDAGDPRPLAVRFGRVGEIAVVDLDAALGRGSNAVTIRELCRLAPCRVGGGIRDVAAARAWLAAGATQVVLGTAAVPEILGALPRERVVAALDAVDGEVVVDGWRTKTGRSILERMAELRELVGGFLVTFVEREGRLGGTALDRVPALVEAAGGARVTIAGGITTASEVAALDRLGADAQVGMALYTDRLPLAEAFAGPLRSDRPDGLWATLVADERGVALGLAWSDAESLAEALKTGRGVYHSRRRGLWVKGETSGDVQELLRVDADCDRDVLRFTVRQSGGFCHLGTPTCFGEEGGLARLERTLAQRVAGAPEDSYTGRLLTEEGLLEAKLLEEAGELAAAEGREEVVHEAADVMYFASVAMARAGVTLAEVEAELDRRAGAPRRGGDRKPWAGQAGPPSPAAELSQPGAPGPGLDTAGASPERRGGRGRDLGAAGASSAGGEGAQSGAGAPGRGAGVPPGAPARLLRVLDPSEVAPLRRAAVDPETLAAAAPLVEAVRTGGEAALRALAERFGDLAPGAPLVHDRAALGRALAGLSAADRGVLERTVERVRAFAQAQRDGLPALDTPVEGGRAGIRYAPVERAGCYAPGGRYPLPSSVIMTAVTARVAGVAEVWVASPRPAPVTLAAAALSGADALLAVGGAQAIAALAFGAGPVPPCDAVVGPGNRWVTAAKQLVGGHVAIDLLAGPSELVVLADDAADATLVAADLLAQAEHDPDALPILVALDAALLDRVEAALAAQLSDLPTAAIARRALAKGFAVVADADLAVSLCDRLAPEHLAVHVADLALADRLRHYGALFLGEGSAEVLGDYGAGPNHTLPTGGTARSTGGLSVLTFLRPQTWLHLVDPRAIARDAAALARLEGLEAHARAADRRSGD